MRINGSSWRPAAPRLGAGKVALIGLVVVAVVGVIVFAIWDHNKWSRWCEDQGGRVDSHTSWTSHRNSDGTSSSDSDTTYYCLDRQTGGIIDIR
jgi:hypothetical protein